MNRSKAPAYSQPNQLIFDFPTHIQFKNGVNLYWLRDVKDNSVKLDLEWAAGSKYQKKRLVASFTNKLMLSGNSTKSAAQIAEEIDSVLILYQHQLKQGIQVSTSYQDLPEIVCYPEQLNQVWANLIHNAIQAMGRQGKLDITATGHQGLIRVQVTDSGCGIPAEIQDKIFEPFFTTKVAGVGTGLGLDIARQIIQQHHGQIEVESQPGRTTFTVWLPIQQAITSSSKISSI